MSEPTNQETGADEVAQSPETPHATQSPESQSSHPVESLPPTEGKEPVALRFDDLSLDPKVLEAVHAEGYETPTPIQAQIIPHMLEGSDVLAQSQTGSGKTAAFALPILSQIDVHQRLPKVLVLAPTRELAIQVAKSFSTYGSHLKRFNVAAIYGGQEYEPQLKQLRRGVQVVVGTPGRVIDHVKRGTLDLSQIECLVLDEADEMLNMGFLEDVEYVLEHIPDERQIALFSATLPPPIRKISQRYLSDPARVTIKKKTVTAESIRQRAMFVAPRHKQTMLKLMLEVEETDGVIVFTKTKDATISVAEGLIREGLSAVALNGDMPQKVRERTIERLKDGKLDILVATDVAARGLDVSRISHVINFDVPHDTESYIHRVGRTGRAGRKGEAIIFLTNAQRGKLRLIERATKQPIEVIQPPTANEINAIRVKRFKQRITDVTAARDLTMFKELIAEYAEEAGKPLDIIAAALAHIGQNGRPFLFKDMPKTSRKSERADRHDDQSRNRHDGERPQRPRQLGPPEPGMQRYRIEVGRRDGVKPGNIVGAVANEAGIDGEFIGPIKIYETFATVDLPEGMPRDTYESLQTTWVSGRQLKIRVDRGPDRDGKGSGKRGGRKSRDGKRGQRKFKGKPTGKRQKSQKSVSKSFETRGGGRPKSGAGKTNRRKTK